MTLNFFHTFLHILLSLVHIRRGATGGDVRIDGKRRDGLTASNVNTRNGNATVLPYRSGSDGKSWIDPTFHTVDGDASVQNSCNSSVNRRRRRAPTTPDSYLDIFSISNTALPMITNRMTSTI